MSGSIRMGQRQNNFNKNYNNKFNNTRQGTVRNGRFVNNKKPMNQGSGVQNMNGPNATGSRDVVIRRNIEHMKQVAQKKRVAQERYYGQGQSPMIRASSGPVIKQETNARGSVQQRLGNKTMQRNNNTSHNNNHNNSHNNNHNNNHNNSHKQNFMPRRNNQPFVSGLRSDKMVRVQNFQKKKQIRFQNMNGIKTVSSTGKVVYLQPVRRPPNYTVRVDNDRKSNYKHHVAKDLNPQLQQEIKLIQNKNMRQIVAPVPAAAPLPVPVHITPSYEQIDRLPIVATTRTLHERFSMI